MSNASLPTCALQRAGPAWADALRLACNGQQRYLLLLSHMRSYSSVLAHVLGSAPEIQGSEETLVRYRNVFDLWRMRSAIRRTTGQPLNALWLLDKVLHNHIRPPERFLGIERMRVLIFLRQPAAALASIMNLARERNNFQEMADAQAGCDYYVQRLHRLREDGRRYGKRALYFDAETLIERPPELLRVLGCTLGLERPLSARYGLVPSTGNEGFGDWLPNIRAGRILGPEASTVRHSVRISATVLTEAQAAYDRCREALLRSCEVGPLTRPTGHEAPEPGQRRNRPSFDQT